MSENVFVTIRNDLSNQGIWYRAVFLTQHYAFDQED